MADKQNPRPPRRPKATKQLEPSSNLSKGTDPELIEQVALLIRSEVTFSGPVPPAAMLEQYEKILPGCADRLITLAENNQNSHHQHITQAQKNDTRRIRATTLTSFLFATVAVFAIWAGHPITGIFVISIGMLPTLIRVLKKGLVTPEKG